MYDGWMMYGGQEIFNGPRTKAYLQHLQPSLAVGKDCCECDTLAPAIGDEVYSTPAQDDAAWFNPYATETAGFYGFIPLAVEGFEDSTWTVPITDLMGDGSVSGRGRRAGRDLRFRMLACAESEKAMSRGLAWLTDALGSENCASGDCGGAQICYLTDCPGCCAEDAPEALPTVAHLDYRAMTPAQAATAAAADWSSAIAPVGMTRTGQTHAHWLGPVVSVEHAMSGFLPGATYRIALAFGTTNPTDQVVVSIPGAAERLAPRSGDTAFGYSPAPESGTTVWQFVATECDHRIVITSPTDLEIGMLDVSMTTPVALAYSGQPGTFPAHSSSWTTPLLANAALTVTQPAYGQWAITAAANTAIGSGLGEVKTTVGGLAPSRTYRMTLLATVDQTVGADTGYVTITGETGEVLKMVALPSDALSNGLHGGWVTVEFVPTTTMVTIAVANTPAVTVGPTNTLTVAVRSMTVEEVAPYIPDPDTTDPLRRYLRDVVLTSGPSVTKVHPSYTAVMKEIEWTMRANVPDPLGEDYLVTTRLGAGRWIVPEVACALGEAVRTNYIPNPSGEYGVLGWPVPAGSTVTNPTSATAKSGTKVIRVTHTTANTTARSIALPAVPVVPGTPWTFTVPMRASKSGREVVASLVWLKAATILSSTHHSLTTTDSLVDWQGNTVTGSAPPGATHVQPYITMNAPAGGFVANEWVEFDGLLLEQTYGERAYFDGDSLYGTWSGTKGNSTSGYERTNAALVFDPACPPSPAAPRPPDIVNLCLTVPATWIRYVLEVPALASAIAPRSTPTVTITTGNNAARGVRVRMYANPFSQSIEDVDPCSYCGEFLISYMPAQAALTVDAADKTASIVTSDGEQSALGLLFGSDGGPITWPVMGCAIPYLVAIDVDADVAPLIAASLSITPIF